MVDLATEPPKPRLALHRSRRPPLVLACAVVLLVFTSVTAAVWITHWRHSFSPALVKYPIGGASTPGTAGHTLVFDDMVDESSVFSHPNHPGTLTLHISSIRAVVHGNTSAAKIIIEKCVLSAEGHVLDGQPASDARGRCATLRPFHSGTVKLGYDPGDVDILIAIQPVHAGTVDVHGVKVSFTAGWRSGTQHTGLHAATVTH